MKKIITDSFSGGLITSCSEIKILGWSGPLTCFYKDFTDSLSSDFEHFLSFKTVFSFFSLTKVLAQIICIFLDMADTVLFVAMAVNHLYDSF